MTGLASSTTKKVLIRRFDREPLTGFVNPQSYLLASGVELMKTDGTVAVVPYHEIKTVCFVRDFEPTEAPPDRLVFHTRPKMDGLWVRMRFRDGEVMDGILKRFLNPKEEGQGQEEPELQGGTNGDSERG